MELYKICSNPIAIDNRMATDKKQWSYIKLKVVLKHITFCKILTISYRELKLSWSIIDVSTLYSASFISSMWTWRLLRKIPTACDLLFSSKWMTCCFTRCVHLEERSFPSDFLSTLANISAKWLTLITGSSSVSHTVSLASNFELQSDTCFSCIRFQNNGFIGDAISNNVENWWTSGRFA